MLARSWQHADELLQVHPIDVAVVDPSIEGAGDPVELERLMTGYPSVSFIAYVQLTAAAFRAVTEFAPVGLRSVVLYSHDDSTQRFLAVLEKARTSPLTARVVDELVPRMINFPMALAKTVQNLFAEPHRYPSAQDIASGARLPLVRVYRSFHDAGFSSPKKVHIAAKVLRGFCYLGDPAHSVLAVSRKLGYRQARIFADHSTSVFGLKPSRLRAHISEDQAVGRLLRWMEADVAV
jgi:AraC-like DNA-binding protein